MTIFKDLIKMGEFLVSRNLISKEQWDKIYPYIAGEVYKAYIRPDDE